jgi:hypothetical protein
MSRMTSDCYRRALKRGWIDPNDRNKPGCSLRIKCNDGSYSEQFFRYALPIDQVFYQRIHPEDVGKVRPGQLPVGHPLRTS